MPEHKFTPEATKINGLTKKILKLKMAGPFILDSCKSLANFLDRHKDFPIVAHNVQYDLNKVLVPAFKSVKGESYLPIYWRWQCTQNMSSIYKNWNAWNLDDVLENCGFERRKEDAHHEALDDCRYAAKVYMKLKTMAKPIESQFGFANKWTKDD